MSSSSPAQTSTRLHQLDGLRGIAIILVVLNHLRLDQLYISTPAFLHPFFGMLTGNGKIGVSILFLLSGYLMGSLYPVVPSTLSFWQKRYTRIFPALISMCASLAVVRFWWDELTLWQSVQIIAGFMIVGGLAWRLLQHLPYRHLIGKILFYFFITSQLVAAVGYVFFLGKIPSTVFYQVWPEWLRQIFIFIGNATITLPFGNYLPQLDGVYWSVITEVLFYLIYPFLFLPLVRLIQAKKSAWFGAAIFGLSLPFFYSLSVLFESLWGFKMLTIHLAVYFLLGVIIGCIQNGNYFQKLSTQLKKIPTIAYWVITLAAIFALPIARRFIDLGTITEMMVWSIPIGIMFAMTLNQKTSWAKFLSQRWLVVLGEYSYAIYLTHTIAIELYTKGSGPKSPQEMVAALQTTLPLIFVLSWLLHYTLELPYFNRSQTPAAAKQPQQNLNPYLPKTSRTAVAIFICGFITTLWLGHKVPVTLSAHVVNHAYSELKYPVLLNDQPLDLTFQADENNFGMAMISIKPLSNEEVVKLGLQRGPNDLESLQITIRDAANTVVTTNSYPLYQIFESRFHPIGLPIVPNSQGQKYTVSLQITKDRTHHIVRLVDNGFPLRTVYFLNKKELLSNPLKLISFGWEKLTQPFAEPTAQRQLILASPLMVGLLWSSWHTRRSRAKV
jgi:peptidoglycan/LPS O-acetylase OafA/YrhL